MARRLYKTSVFLYDKPMDKLKVLLPKGRIYDNVAELFAGAGISIKLPERAYRPVVNQDDLEAKVMKPQNNCWSSGRTTADLPAAIGLKKPKPTSKKFWTWASIRCVLLPRFRQA